MKEAALEVLFYSLAIYGAWMLLSGMLRSFQCKRKCEDSNLRWIVLVKNQEDVIEGIIRSIWEEGESFESQWKRTLTVVDMGSTDDTYEILLKLKKENEFLEVLRESEKEKVFTSWGGTRSHGKVEIRHFT